MDFSTQGRHPSSASGPSDIGCLQQKPDQPVEESSSVKHIDWEWIKAYALAGYGCSGSEGLQRRINYKIKCRKGKLIRCLSISLSFRLLQPTYSHIIGVCKLFSCNPS